MPTDDQLRAVMPDLGAKRRQSLLPFLTRAMEEFAIVTPARQAAFLAQLAHESGQLRFMEELWGPTEAQMRYEPVSTLAARLGNTETGDGARFKGRGPIQLTGRANYRRFGDALDLDLVATPVQAASPEVAFRIAGLFWRQNGLNELADVATRDGFRQITRRINGGLNGFDDRVRFYEVACRVFGVVPGSSERPRMLPRGAGSRLDRGAEAIRLSARSTRAAATRRSQTRAAATGRLSRSARA